MLVLGTEQAEVELHSLILVCFILSCIKKLVSFISYITIVGEKNN